ncbi:MAG: hypothetical protein Kow00109_12280 [Acidobacteriota bacterium]
MAEYHPLSYEKGHLLLHTGEKRWLLDTGAPQSFGRERRIELDGAIFSVGEAFLGLSIAVLERYLELPCAGLLGADILGRFDFLWDVPGERAVVSRESIPFEGNAVRLEWVLGVPILAARIADRQVLCVFDTGAQLSYLSSAELRALFPLVGTARDFYPSFGAFETEVRRVEIAVGDIVRTLRCGALPPELEYLLAITGCEGILGAELISDRRTAYLPRRSRLVL